MFPIFNGETLWLSFIVFWEILLVNSSIIFKEIFHSKTGKSRESFSKSMLEIIKGYGKKPQVDLDVLVGL